LNGTQPMCLLLASSDVGVFGSIHRHLRGIGVSSIACGYMLVTYYLMLLAWVCNAFFDSFGNINFWAQEQVTGSEAKAYFYNEIIGMSTLGDDLRPTRLVGRMLAIPSSLGVLSTCVLPLGSNGRMITYFTMGLPVILLFVFLGRALSLPGSQDRVDEYIHDSNWEVLTECPEVWSKAVSRIFFSLSVTFGIMSRTEPAYVNSCVVAISNCLFSFVAGFAVFATLGHLALIEGLDSISQHEYSSFGLLFGSWPVTLVSLFITQSCSVRDIQLNNATHFWEQSCIGYITRRRALDPSPLRHVIPPRNRQCLFVLRRLPHGLGRYQAFSWCEQEKDFVCTGTWCLSLESHVPN
jgi:SNF family Na+-dependent transporter